MKETIVVNGKTYPAKEITFNFVCDLGMNGIGFDDMGTKLMPAIRCYVAYCMGTSVEKAGEIMEQHFNNILDEDDKIENPFAEILEVFNEKIETSSFFRALNKTTEKETPKSNSKKKEKEVSE